jgi:HSP20 family protein
MSDGQELKMGNEVKKEPDKNEKSGLASYGEFPSRAMREFREHFDRLYHEFSSSLWNFPFRQRPLDVEPSWRRRLPLGENLPAVDLAEHDKFYQITVELPGVDEKDVDLALRNGVLTINGEKREEKEETKKGYFVSERYYGAFHRSFRIPDDVDQEKIEARFEDGILKVTLPKSPEAQQQTRKISIKDK